MQNPDKIEEDIPLSPVLSCTATERRISRAKRKKSKTCINLEKKFALLPELKESKSSSISDSLTKSSFESTGTGESPQVASNPGPSEFKTLLEQTESNNRKCLMGAFKTAAGATIHMGQDAIQASNALLSDIYNPLEDQSERPRKYSFLSKLDKTEKADSPEMFKGFDCDVNEQSRIEITTFLDFVSQYYARYKADVEKLKPLSSEPIGHLGFRSAAGHAINLSEKALQRMQTFDTDHCLSDTVSETDNTASRLQPQFDGFQTASGKSFHISDAALKKAKYLMQDLQDQPDCKMQDKYSQKRPLENITNNQKPNQSMNKKMCGAPEILYGKAATAGVPFGVEFASASGKTLIPSKQAAQKAQNLFNSIDTEFKKLPEAHSKTENEKKQQFLESAGLKPIDFIPETAHLGLQSASGKALSVSESSLRKAQELLEGSNISVTKPKSLLEDMDDDLLRDNSFLEEIEASTFRNEENSRNRPTDRGLCNISSNSRDISTELPMKRLGISYSKQLQISKSSLEKANALINGVSTLTPPKTGLSNIFNSTPLKESIELQPDTDITPIKPIATEHLNTAVYTDDPIIIKESTTSNINSCCKEIEDEINKLEEKVIMLSRRQQALNFQRKNLSSNVTECAQRNDGVLYIKKHNSNRISLKNGLILKAFSSQTSNVITPQNAELVHFDCSKENVPFISTRDGALVLPSVDNVVGVHEIERAFKVLDNVQSNLIPKGWISNHYKWIVWKLASYQNFASNLSGCLNVENVMQQLKYRYDREIDKAQRSTLRKIIERDSASQKRLVLCVSNLFKISSSKYDIELTDGWYGIRTFIDDALSYQVNTKKIRIGTKLVISGAELLNCEGSHPLDPSNLALLKISCNSTRRAAWYTKLGYQKCAAPLRLKVNSCYAFGGAISCVTLYIARVHPIKYKEKLNTLITWRNQKAEEILARKWETKWFKETEIVRQVVMREQQMKQEEKQSKRINLGVTDIQSVDCPETLHTLLEQSKDPETFVESLSLEQQAMLYDYQQCFASRRQEEISDMITNKMKKLPLSERDVTSVLQLRVVDVLDPALTCLLQVWKPKDSHLEMLKEGLVFDVFNAFLQANGDLSTTNRTRFKPAQNLSSDFDKYKRKLTPISTLFNLEQPICFNEFDTVGIIIELSINDANQEVWLSDLNKSLLLIQIFDGPRNCLILDNLRPGKVVSVCNLVLAGPPLQFARATASHSTIFAKYPQYRHLEEGLKSLRLHITKDTQSFLDDCTAKIKTYGQSNTAADSSTRSTPTLGDTHQEPSICDESEDESTFVQSRITPTDVIMSMMEID